MLKQKQLSLSDIYDFYTLYAMKSELEEVTPGIHKKVDLLYADVSHNLDDLVSALHPALGQYLYLASFAEARHAKGRCSHIIEDVTAYDYSREQASKAAVRFNPTLTLEKLIELFNSNWFGGGFGGKKWGDIAKASYKYFTDALPPLLFVDHVVSVQHNGGMAFSKSSSANLVKLSLSDGGGDLTRYLNIRAEDMDILDPKTDVYVKYALGDIRTTTLHLLRRHWLVYREKSISKWVDAILAEYKKGQFDQYGFPDPYLLKFGNEEVGEVKNTVKAKLENPYTPQEQNLAQGIGAYNEFIGQSGEKDRDGNELPKSSPVVSSPSVEGVPQGKYFIVNISEW